MPNVIRACRKRLGRSAGPQQALWATSGIKDFRTAREPGERCIVTAARSIMPYELEAYSKMAFRFSKGMTSMSLFSSNSTVS